jgi:hypothetical protein
MAQVASKAIQHTFGNAQNCTRDNGAAHAFNSDAPDLALQAGAIECWRACSTGAVRHTPKIIDDLGAHEVYVTLAPTVGVKHLQGRPSTWATLLEHLHNRQDEVLFLLDARRHVAQQDDALKKSTVLGRVIQDFGGDGSVRSVFVHLHTVVTLPKKNAVVHVHHICNLRPKFLWAGPNKVKRTPYFE